MTEETNTKTKTESNSRPMDPYLSTDRALSKGRAAAYLAGGMGGKDAVSPEERKQNMNMARAVTAGVMAAENYVGLPKSEGTIEDKGQSLGKG